jgi:putative acetyltransferase
MDAAMTIRDATPADYPAIRAVISHAFGQTEEANLVEKLRADGDVLVDLVHASDIAIQGHIFYSPLAIEGPDYTIKAAALAPVSVLKGSQKSGIGSALIRAGNARCAELGLDAIVVLGHEAYYPKFGFSAKLVESLEAPFSGPHFMALELKPGALKQGGKLRYAKAFGL